MIVVRYFRFARFTPEHHLLDLLEHAFILDVDFFFQEALNVPRQRSLFARKSR